MKTSRSPASLKSTCAARNVAEAMRLSLLGGHVGEGRAEQRSTHAIAERIDLLLPGLLGDGIDRGEDALVHVVFKGLLRELRVRVHPGNGEHGEPLRHRPLDVALLRDEVEDVELVDPRRHDEQGPLEHFFRARAVLDELDELVLEHDLARRDREVPTDLEGRQVGLADAQQIL